MTSYLTAFERQDALELLYPRSQLNLPRPRTTMLAMDMEVFLGDGVGVQPFVFIAGNVRLGTAARDATVDDEMRDMNIFRSEFSRHTLGHPSQREFAHRKWRRTR